MEGVSVAQDLLNLQKEILDFDRHPTTQNGSSPSQNQQEICFLPRSFTLSDQEKVKDQRLIAKKLRSMPHIWVEISKPE